ncbi:hypothetical protein Q1695_012208 [Nippostrongylus brasiliensis]|nr:hypothetical protein Q1695_012208 [Nippostrongylus brasiliensis]
MANKNSSDDGHQYEDIVPDPAYFNLPPPNAPKLSDSGETGSRDSASKGSKERVARGSREQKSKEGGSKDGFKYDYRNRGLDEGFQGDRRQLVDGRKSTKKKFLRVIFVIVFILWILATIWVILLLAHTFEWFNIVPFLEKTPIGKIIPPALYSPAA